jgi:hypothetical protein
MQQERFEHIDLKLANMDTYDYSDATVLYYSMHEAGTTVKDLQKRLENKRLRIITKDLSLCWLHAAWC